MGQTSFGRSPEHKEAVVLEPIFLLMFHGGFSYSEAYNLPVPYVRWFLERIGKELKPPEDNGTQAMPRMPKTQSGRNAAAQLRKF